MILNTCSQLLQSIARIGQPFFSELFLHVCGKPQNLNICVKLIGYLYMGLFLDSSVPLIYLSVFIQYHTVLKSGPPALLFFKVALIITGPLHFHMNFTISLSISTKMPIVVLIEIDLNIQVHLRKMNILTILSFLILIKVSQFIQVFKKNKHKNLAIIQFPVSRSFTMFIPNYLIFLMILYVIFKFLNF